MVRSGNYAGRKVGEGEMKRVVFTSPFNQNVTITAKNLQECSHCGTFLCEFTTAVGPDNHTRYCLVCGKDVK